MDDTHITILSRHNRRLDTKIADITANLSGHKLSQMKLEPISVALCSCSRLPE